MQSLKRPLNNGKKTHVVTNIFVVIRWCGQREGMMN